MHTRSYIAAYMEICLFAKNGQQMLGGGGEEGWVGGENGQIKEKTARMQQSAEKRAALSNRMP